MQVSSHFRGPPLPGFNSWMPLEKLIPCHIVALCWQSQGRIASLCKFGVRSWVVRLLYALSVCTHICICIFYAYGIALPYSLGFISSMNVSVLSNPYQSVMSSLSLCFEIIFLLKIYSGIGLVYTRLALSRHLVGAWPIMWVRMSMVGCFATRATCCLLNMVVSLHNQIVMCGAGCKFFRPAANHVKLSVFACPREGFIPAYCVLMAAFEIQSWNLPTGGRKDHLVKYFLVQWSSDRHRWERWVLGHTRLTSSGGFWILWFVLLQERKKNESQGFGTVAREAVGMFALVCVRGGDADGLQLQLWESRAGAGALRAGWGAGNLLGKVQLLPLAVLQGMLQQPRGGLGCMDREQVMVWEKNFTDRSFWQPPYTLKVLSYAF